MIKGLDGRPLVRVRPSSLSEDFVDEDECLTAVAGVPIGDGAVVAGVNLEKPSLGVFEFGDEVVADSALGVTRNLVGDARGFAELEAVVGDPDDDLGRHPDPRAYVLHEAGARS